MEEPWDELFEAWREAGRAGLSLADFAAARGVPESVLRERLGPLLELERDATAASLLPPDIDEGRDFAGHRLERWLGEGGSGVVYAAIRHADGARLALKVVHPLLCGVPERRELLLREARVAAALEHPGIVRVMGCGVERGWTWITTELIEGKPLSELGPLPRRPACNLLLKVAQAISYAHAQGVVHRDLKPANVLVDAQGEPHILDFGLARTAAEPLSFSATGALLGTPQYMAPEQAQSPKETEASVDLHACGLLLWELVSGRSMTNLVTPAGQFLRLARGERALPLREIRQLEGPVRTIVERCTRTAPKDRFRSMPELCEALAAGARGEPVSRDTAGRLRGVLRATLRSRRSRAVAALAALSGMFALWPWPVQLDVDTYPSGYQLWVDDVERGTTPLRLSLGRGSHSWRARFGDAGPWFEGEWEVESAAPRRELLVLQPPHGVPRLQGAGVADQAPGAWVQVSTPEPAIELEVDGRIYPGAPGISALRLPLGEHTFALRCEGFEERRFQLQLTRDRLHCVSFELDRSEDEWTTTLAYSALEESVLDGITELRSATRIWESAPVASGPYHADRVYFAPDSSGAQARVDFLVNLPSGWEDLEVELTAGPQRTGPTAWSRVELGPSFEALVTVAEFVPGRSFDWSRESWNQYNVQRVRPPERALQRLRELARGNGTLCVRLSSGGAPAPSATVAWAQMLRCEFLPSWPSGGFLQWAPALKFRTR